MFIINTIYAILICILFSGCIYSFFLNSFRFARGSIQSQFCDKKGLSVLFIFLLFSFFCCIYIIKQNNFVYYWDYGGYWTISYSTMKRLFVHPGTTIKYIYHSILYYDYNALIPLFLILPMKIFGYSFTRYVLFNFLLFLIPVWLLLIFLYEKLLYKNQTFNFDGIGINRSFIVILFLLVTFNPFYIAMLYGYLGVICLIPAVLSIFLFIDYNPIIFSKKQIKRDLLISGLLLLTFLFRRYFAYYIVGYGSALTAYSFYKVIEGKKDYDVIKIASYATYNLSIIAVTAFLALFIFFHPLLVHVLFNNYAGQYSAYDVKAGL